jgi:hypothetical protein
MTSIALSLLSSLIYLRDDCHKQVVLVSESRDDSNRCSAPEKQAPDYIPSTPVDRSMGPHPVSLPLTTREAVEKATKLSTVGY